MELADLISKVIQLNKEGEKDKKKYLEVIDLLSEEILKQENSDVLYAEKSQAYFRLNKNIESKNEAEIAITINSKNAKAYHYLANYYQHSNQKEYKKAEEYYHKAIECDPDFSYPYNGLGILYDNQKEYKKAEEYYHKAIKCDPDYSSPFNGLGNLYYAQKEYKKAEEYYQKAIECDPDYSYPYNGLGNIYKNQKEYKKAEEYYLKAIECDPDFSYPYNGLGNLYDDQKEYKKAEEYYHKAIECDPDFSYPYNGLGNLYDDQKEYKKAEEYYHKAIECDPDFSYPYNGLGNLYYAQEEYKKAEEYYLKAIECDPDYSSPYNGLGNIYKNQKEYKEAEKLYNTAIEKDLEVDAPYYNLGKLYYLDIEQKELKKAKNNFEKYIALTRSNPDEFTDRAKAFVKEIEDLLSSPELSNIESTKNKIKELLQFKDGEISHFTSLSTVNFMVKKKSPFRLSEATFLNDSSEGKTLFDFLDYNQATDNARHEYTFAKKPFIGSFVHAGKHNDLALWRLYGKEGGEEGKGCSITLDSTAFLQSIKENATDATKQNFDNEFQLYKVAYWDDDQDFIVENKINEALNKTMKALKKHVDTFKQKKYKKADEDKRAYEALNVQKALNEIAYLFKNKEYQYENEIRLIVKNSFGYKKHLDFDTEKLATKVYIKLCPIQKCISAISIGPKTPNKDDWAAYFHYYFDQIPSTEKMEKIKIVVSTLPYK